MPLESAEFPRSEVEIVTDWQGRPTVILAATRAILYVSYLTSDNIEGYYRQYVAFANRQARVGIRRKTGDTVRIA